MRQGENTMDKISSIDKWGRECGRTLEYAEPVNDHLQLGMLWFEFLQPAESSLWFLVPRGIGLDIQDRRALDHIHSLDLQHIIIPPDKLKN
jgi:hypothetical protein